MAKIAVLGFGIVGSGVPEVLERGEKKIIARLGEKVEVKYILDIRDFPGHKYAEKFVKDIDIVLQDSEIAAVVETIGGLKPALGFVKRALAAGKHVVTSNKELVAVHGAELIELAKQNKVCFLFEASVGGGMPLITPIYRCIGADKANSFQGIVNGTTNFMLTQMEKERVTFEVALGKAQELGYAETVDPSSDIDGIDAARKTAILASICFGMHIHPENVRAEGIRKIIPEDMAMAKKIDAAVKLVAWGKYQDGKLSCGVEPMMVSRKNLLAGVDDVYNSVRLSCELLGDVQFYGQGAGRLPTANAVVADVLDAVQHGAQLQNMVSWQATEPVCGYWEDTEKYDYYLRILECINLEVVQAIPNLTLINESCALIKGVTPAELKGFIENSEENGCRIEAALKWLN